MRRFPLHQRLEHLGHGQWFEGLIGLDMDGAVGFKSEPGAQGLLRLRRSNGDQHHLLGLARLLEAHGLLHGDLVEGVHGHLHVGQFHPRLIGLDSDLDVVIDDPFDRHQHFHD